MRFPTTSRQSHPGTGLRYIFYLQVYGIPNGYYIENTIHQKLPDDFQSAEYLEKHGFIDKIVERSELKGFLAKMLNYWGF